MRRVLFIGALALFGCKSSVDVEGTVPEDVRFVLIVELNEDGSVERAGALTPWSDGPNAIVADRTHRTILFGYTSVELENAGILAAAEADAGRTSFEVSVGCQNTLPAPGWTAEWTVADTLQDARVPIPALTSEWLQKTCPAFDPAIGVDVPCRDGRCAATVLNTKDCVVELDVECDLGRTTVVVQPDGGLCVQNNACTDQSGFPGATTISCMEPTCDVHFEIETSRTRRAFDVETVKLSNVEPTNPRQVGLKKLFPFNLQQGFFTDFAALDDRIVLTGTANVFDRDCPHTDTTPRSLLFLDIDTLTPIRTSSAAPCIRRPARDPHGPGFLAIYSNEATVFENRLGRFGPDGRLVESAAFDAATFGDSDQTTYELLVTSDGATIVVLVATQDVPAAETQRSTFAVFDARTLAPQSRFSVGQPPNFYTLTERTPRTFLAIDGDSETWFLADLDREDARPGFEIPINDAGPGATYGAYFHQSSSTQLSVGEGNAAVNGVREGASTSWQANFAREDVRVFDLATWPGDDDLVFAVGGQIEPDHYAFGAFLSVSEQRLLPGGQSFGQTSGIVVKPDGRGNLLVLHPWSAELSRITRSP